MAEDTRAGGGKLSGREGGLEAERDRARPALVLAGAPALLQLPRHAESTGHARELIALGRVIDVAFAWGRRWETWKLMTVLDSARESGDRAAQAWARHQLGTRAYCLGDVPHAVRLLEEALEVRQDLGDEAGAAATRHNLEFIAAPPGNGEHEGPEDGGGEVRGGGRAGGRGSRGGDHGGGRRHGPRERWRRPRARFAA